MIEQRYLKLEYFSNNKALTTYSHFKLDKFDSSPSGMVVILLFELQRKRVRSLLVLSSAPNLKNLKKFGETRQIIVEIWL